MQPKVAYLINQYPKASHGFIRREILALERQGYAVLRIALRAADVHAESGEDREERRRTRYVLDAPVSLLCAAACTLASSPARFLGALGLTLRMARRAERPLPYHFAYLAEACRILPWLRSFGATHLHAHFGTNSAEVAMLAHALGGPPYSFTVHGPEEFDKPERLHLADKARGAAFVVAVSSFGRGQLFRWLPQGDWRKVKLVHCGLEAAFHDGGSRALPETLRLVCVGRLCEQKGQLLLVEAIARLARKGVRVELVLAGDGELRLEAERLIALGGLGDRIRITGWIDSHRVREEILAARALVLPSFAEGLPVVLMEAMALGRPVLTTYVGGIPELVRHGEHGWLVPAGDVDALVEAIEECVSRPSVELRRMGEAGRKRVLERHAVNAQAQKLGALFEQGNGLAWQSRT
jgi:glycosyltransferase involved in cell wall biosynthesis